jgi:hypothetical protein
MGYAAGCQDKHDSPLRLHEGLIEFDGFIVKIRGEPGPAVFFLAGKSVRHKGI